MRWITLPITPATASAPRMTTKRIWIEADGLLGASGTTGGTGPSLGLPLPLGMPVVASAAASVGCGAGGAASMASDVSDSSNVPRLAPAVPVVTKIGVFTVTPSLLLRPGSSARALVGIADCAAREAGRAGVVATVGGAIGVDLDCDAARGKAGWDAASARSFKYQQRLPVAGSTR